MFSSNINPLFVFLVRIKDAENLFYRCVNKKWFIAAWKKLKLSNLQKIK